MSISTISGTDLVVKFGSVAALNGCSITFPYRGLVSLIGENGSGKSTLLDVLSGFVSLSGGRLADGTNGALTRSHLLNAATRVHQRVVLPEGLRVYEYTAICARPRLAGSPFTPKAFFEERKLSTDSSLGRLVALAGISDLACPVDHLSWGQQRIVSVCGALMTPKPVILLDEPFAGIVSSLGVALMEVLADEACRRLIVFAEHDLAYAARADRVVVLKQGRVASDFGGGELPESSLMQYFGN
jgi:ABC-type branched-subunit amino acid transport system ATPase component